MQNTERDTDPYLGFRFRVEISGLQIGGFSEVSGLQVEIEVHDYREGGVNEYMHRLAGPARYPNNLVLKHGIMDSEVMWNWQQDVVSGKVQRRNGSIILMNAAGEYTWRWKFREAYAIWWS